MTDGSCREKLWKAGLDYRHGTSHGVGAHLGVHEGPIRIGQPRTLAHLKSGIKAGIILSDEVHIHIFTFCANFDSFFYGAECKASRASHALLYVSASLLRRLVP